MVTDLVLLGIFPYVAITLAIVVALYRRASDQYTYSSLSSQFLESKKLFYGSIPWHYGIVTILIGHIIGFLIPRGVLAWNGVPVRLYILEVVALSLGFMALFGLIVAIIRRMSDARVMVVTSKMDVLLLLLLLLQAFTGVYTAIFYRWGSSWYAAAAAPYLWSIVTFSPNVNYVSGLPIITKIHIINAWVLFAIFPFSRLIHLVSLPIGYLTRPYQVVWWNRRDYQAQYELAQANPTAYSAHVGHIGIRVNPLGKGYKSISG